MKLKKLFPSRFVKAEDVEGRPVVAIVTQVVQQLVGDDAKPVVFFEGSKPLVLNKTNGNVIAVLADSEETNDWPGTVVELYATTTEFGGKVVPCVRIRAPQATRATHPLPPEHEIDPEDEGEPPS